MKAMIDKPETSREVLDIIDKAFCSFETSEALRLWAVLSALRGPDDKEYEDKRFTLLVRAKAFPRACDSFKLPSGFLRGPRLSEIEKTLVRPSYDESILQNNEHFYSHIRHALDSL